MRRATRQRSARAHQCAQRLLEPLGVVIPWAEQLTFRTDQTRYRRDHAKYLSLIASVTLLHQYQRQQTERVRDGVAERCVIATLADLEVANQLASAVLAPRVESLLPQTRQLLEHLSAYVDRAQCAGAGAPARRCGSRSAKCARRSGGATGRCGGSWCGWWNWSTSWPPARRGACSATINCSTTRPSTDGAPWRLGLVDVAQLPASRGPRRRSAAAGGRPEPARGHLTIPPPADGGGVRRPTGGPPAGCEIAVKSCRDRHLRQTPAACAKNEAYPRAKSRPWCLVPLLNPYVFQRVTRRPE